MNQKLCLTLTALFFWAGTAFGQTWQGTPVNNSGNDNTELGEPPGGQTGTPTPAFELEVHGSGTFGDGNWGRGILLSVPNNTTRGSGIMWERLGSGGADANNFFIAGPQSGGQIYTGDFFTGISLGQNPGDQITYISRIDGNSSNGSSWGSIFGGGLGYNNPIRGHTQYFRDVYLFARNEQPRVHPRLGINVGGNQVTASLHVGCQNNGGGNPADFGRVRFECLDNTIIPTQNIVCDDDGNLTYAPLNAGGIQNSCATVGQLPVVSNANGDLSCSVVTELAGNIGIQTTTPTERLDVIGSGTFSQSVNAGNIISGYKLNQQTVLAHGNALAVGYGAGVNGDFNTNVGDDAGQNQSPSSTYNANFGRAAGKENVSGRRNTNLGANAGELSTASSHNTSVGAFAGQKTTGSYNTFVGDQAGWANVTGERNTAIGSSWSSSSGGPAWPDLHNTGSFGFMARVTTSNSQRFGDEQVQRWGFGLDPSVLSRVMRVRLPGTTTTGTGTTAVEAYMDAGGIWYQISDRNMKTNFATLDHQTTLKQLGNLDVSGWTYSTDEAAKHIGPMAQDFYSIFGLGHDETSISASDMSGIALSAIKGVHEIVAEQEVLIEQQQQELESLKETISDLEQKFNSCCSSAWLDVSNDQGSTSPYLKQNTPNPFSVRTTIEYYVPKKAKDAQLVLYSIQGEPLKTITLPLSETTISFEGGSLSSGSYIYSLVIDGKSVDSKIMVLTK